MISKLCWPRWRYVILFKLSLWEFFLYIKISLSLIFDVDIWYMYNHAMWYVLSGKLKHTPTELRLMIDAPTLVSAQLIWEQIFEDVEHIESSPRSPEQFGKPRVYASLWDKKFSIVSELTTIKQMIDMLIPTGITILQAWSTAVDVDITIQEQLATMLAPKRIIHNQLSAQNISDILQPLRDVMHDIDVSLKQDTIPHDQIVIMRRNRQQLDSLMNSQDYVRALQIAKDTLKIIHTYESDHLHLTAEQEKIATAQSIVPDLNQILALQQRNRGQQVLDLSVHDSIFDRLKKKLISVYHDYVLHIISVKSQINILYWAFIVHRLSDIYVVILTMIVIVLWLCLSFGIKPMYLLSATFIICAATLWATIASYAWKSTFRPRTIVGMSCMMWYMWWILWARLTLR